MKINLENVETITQGICHQDNIPKVIGIGQWWIDNNRLNVEYKNIINVSPCKDFIFIQSEMYKYKIYITLKVLFTNMNSEERYKTMTFRGKNIVDNIKLGIKYYLAKYIKQLISWRLNNIKIGEL